MKLSTAALLLLTTSIGTVVNSFTPIPSSVKSLQLRQLNHNGESLIVNYNTVGHEDGDGEEEKERKHYHLLRSRFGMNFMGVLSGQLYVTKALAAGLAGVVTASIGTGDASSLITSTIMDDYVTTNNVKNTEVVVATSTLSGMTNTIESVESMPKSLIGSDNAAVVAMSLMNNLPQTLIADTDTTLEAPVMKEVDATITTTATPPPPPAAAAAKPEVPNTSSVVDVQKVEDAAKAALAEKLALEKKLAEIRSDSAKKAAEKVKTVDVVPPTTTTTTMTTGERDKLIAEEEARIEAAKRAQLEKISKEQEKARLAAEKDAEKARKELEQRAEKAAQKARADAEKKAIEAKIKSVKDREAATAEQAKLKYQEAEKAQAARIRAEENRRKLERESLDVNTSLEFLRQVEEAKKAEAKTADAIRIKAMEERIKLDQEIKQVKGKEFDETMEDIALVAVPSAIIAGVVYSSGALKRESEYESNMIGRDPSSSTPYGMQDNGENSGPFGMNNPFFGTGNQEEENSAPYEMDNRGGYSEPASPPEAPSMQGMPPTFNGPTESKSPFGGGGMPPKSKGVSSSFGKTPLKGQTEKSPFGGGGMPSMPTKKVATPAPKGNMVGQSTGMPKQTESKTKAFGNVYPAPAFPAFQTPLKGRDTSGGGVKGKFGSGPTAFGKAPPKGTFGTPPKQGSSTIPSAFEKTPQKGFVGGQKYSGPPPASKSFGMSPPKGTAESKSPFGGEGMPTKAAAPSAFGKTPLKGVGVGPASTPGIPPKSESAFGKAPSQGMPDSKSPFGGGGMPPKAVAPSSFGNAPLKGTPDSKSPFGGGGPAFGIPPKAESKAFGKASFKFKGATENKSPFGGGGIPTKAVDASFEKKAAPDSTQVKGPFGKSLSEDTGVKKSAPSFGAGPSAFGKAPSKSAFGEKGMPSKVAAPSSFGKAPLKGTPESKGPFGGGGMPSLKGPPNGKSPFGNGGAGVPSKAESKSFGKAPLKGVDQKKGPFGGKDFMSKESIKGPFGKSLVEKNMDTKKGSATVFGGEKKSPFGGGGMPKAQTPGSSFGKAPMKGPAEKGAFGGLGMPPKAAAPGSSFGKAPGPGSSFGKAPMKGPAEKGPFGGGGMPSQAKSASFGKAPMKGSTDMKGPFGGGGSMPQTRGPTSSSFGKAPLKGASSGGPASSFGKTSSAPLFPNKGGIVAESDSSFVARDILLDAELGRGSPEIRSDEPPPSSMPPPPKATPNRRPVFGLGGAFGKSASRQSAGPMPPKGPMPTKGFSSVSPPNRNMSQMKQPMQPPPQAGRPGAGAPFDSGMNQPPPQTNMASQRQSNAGPNVPPSGGEGARMGRSMRQPMSDNFTPSRNMSTSQFADGRPSTSQQRPQPTANVPPPRQNFSQPPPQSDSAFQQGPSDWRNKASPSPIGQFSNSVRDPRRAGGTRLGSLASSGQSQSPPGTARPTATGPFGNNEQQYSGGAAGPGDYQEVTVTDPRTGDRRTIRIPNPNQGGNN